MDQRVGTFEDAFRAEYAGIVRVVAPIVGSIEDAEGIVQGAFLKAFTRWRRIGRYDLPGAWIQRVAVRDAVRFAQRGRRSAASLVEPATALADLAGRIDLHQAVQRLPPQQRACVVLHYLADWPTNQVAEALGCRDATVRVHLHRARAALADALAPDPQELTDGR